MIEFSGRIKDQIIDLIQVLMKEYVHGCINAVCLIWLLRSDCNIE